jgi:hypothetical protein
MCQPPAGYKYSVTEAIITGETSLIGATITEEFLAPEQPPQRNSNTHEKYYPKAIVLAFQFQLRSLYLGYVRKICFHLQDHHICYVYTIGNLVFLRTPYMSSPSKL